MALLDRLRPQPAWKHSDPSTRASAIEAAARKRAEHLREPRARRRVASRAPRGGIAAARNRHARRHRPRRRRRPGKGRRQRPPARDRDRQRRCGSPPPCGRRHHRRPADDVRSPDPRRTKTWRVRRWRVYASRARSAASRVMRCTRSVRLAAIERVTDAAELEAVALNSEHKDSGLAAVERLERSQSARRDCRACAEQGGRTAGARHRA